MVRKTAKPDVIDRYVRNELAADEIVKFEEALVESPELQRELETILGLREALALRPETAADPGRAEPRPGAEYWRPAAVAASLLLAVFSTAMLWKVSNENAGLREDLDLLAQPRTTVLRIPVDTLRSGGADQRPDVVIRKPEGRAALLLDIDYSSMAGRHERIFFELNDERGAVLMAWSIEARAGGRSSVMVDNEHIPAGRIWLRFLSAEGEELDRRLLEFR